MKKTFLYPVLGSLLYAGAAFAQQTEPVALPQIHGNFQVDAQYYNPDSLIGAPKVNEKVLSNGFGNLNYRYGNFSAGMRYESYQNVMQGYDSRYKGQGIPYRYARFKQKEIDITLGNFYEQFGSGLIFRSYEARGLLYDNAMDGIRAIYNPFKGITFKGLIGKQRTFFSYSPGIVRGFDGEININEMFDSLATKKTKVIIGGSFVSKYQADQDPTLVLPENVGCYGGRINVIRGGFNFFTEYAYKINDPSLNNNNSFKDGQGLFASASYATDGLSLLFAGKYIDNMSYRSDRGAALSVAMINFLPALSKPHTYMMMAFYPYATQPNGELSYSGELQYKFKKGSLIGGATGMEVSLNYSASYATDTTRLSKTGADSSHLYGYKINPYGLGPKYFEDLNIEIGKKLNKKLKLTLMGAMQFYNDNVIRHSNPNGGYPNIYSTIGVIDVTYKYKHGSNIRFEAQTLQAHQDKGSWVSGVIEWTPSSNFFASIQDQYNYANPEPDLRFHYYYGTVGFVHDETRITLSYGKLRAGIFCVGGVCRNVPASNGLSLTISSSF